MDTAGLQEIKKIYRAIKDEITSRLDDFSQVWEKGSEEALFAELVFCLLTPQSRANTCWRCVERIRKERLLCHVPRGVCRGRDKQDIAGILARTGARFHNNKAGYIVEARRYFLKNGKLSIKSRIREFDDVNAARDWLVHDIKGIGYKEASHFLRNIGLGENFAILDRHILKNLKSLGVIEEIPASLTKRRYFEIEKRIKRFAEDIKIPISHLDFVLWYKETGEIFK